MITFQCKILSQSIINYCAVFWSLTILHLHRSVTQTGLAGLYFMSHWYLKQHAPTNVVPYVILTLD